MLKHQWTQIGFLIACVLVLWTGTVIAQVNVGTIITEAQITADNIIEEIPDMSQEEIQQVMHCIKVKTTGVRLPFCWRQSYGRGVGTVPGRVPDCPNGYTNNGATCGRAADTIYTKSKLVTGPSGYTNMGAACTRGASTYSKKCTLPWKKHKCRKGYTDNGCTCGRGVKVAPLSSGTCPSGWFMSKYTGRCSNNCPSGYTSTGDTCFKGVSTLGIGSMSCPAGQKMIGLKCFPKGKSCFDNQVKDTGLCYPRCKTDFNGVGPVCWQGCDSGWKDCAAGCAKTKAECSMVVADQVISPLMVAANVLALGLTKSKKAATAAGGAATTVKTISIGGKTVGGASKTGRAFVFLVDFMQNIKPGVLDDVANPTIVRRIWAARTGKNYKVVLTGGRTTKGAHDATQNYLDAFADDFSQQTSPGINRAIEIRFHAKTARFLKKTWGRQQLAELAEANGWVIAQSVLAIASIVDIIGVTGVVSAYAKPICQDIIPFPCVSAMTSYPKCGDPTTLDPSLEVKTDRPGGTYSSSLLTTADPFECQTACANDAACKSWTYVKPGFAEVQAKCHLKKPAPNPTANNDRTSGLNPKLMGAVEYVVSRAGRNYRYFNPSPADPKQCNTACANESRCKVWFYYVTHNLCYLRDTFESTGGAQAGSASGGKVGVAPESATVISGSPLKTGEKIALESLETGKFLSRYSICVSTVDNSKFQHTLTVHAPSPVASSTFTVITVGDKIALKANNGNLVSRCNGCYINGAYPEFVTIHVPHTGTIPGGALFTQVSMGHGHVALRANTGKYLTRCPECATTVEDIEVVSIHDDELSNAVAWLITRVGDF